MSRALEHVAVDVGTATVTIARGAGAGAGIDADAAAPVPAPAGGWRAALTAALGEVRRASVCLAVPDSWLDGRLAGVAALEDVRHVAEDELGLGPVTWAGQLASVTAATMDEHGPGRYVLCDMGASGLRVAMTETDGTAVRTIAARVSSGGWPEFDSALRRLLAADGRRLQDGWHRQAANQRRARLVLGRAATDPELRDARAYSIRAQDAADGGTAAADTVAAEVTAINAGEIIESFAATRERLIADVTELTGGRRPDVAVVTGGFGWFPPAASAIAAATGVADPVTAPPDAAARGALRFAVGAATASTAPTAASPPPEVTLAVHRIHAGLLETADVTLNWTEPFARFPGGPLHLEGDELMLSVNDRSTLVPLTGLPPGPCRIGVRRGWSGATALVVRPADGSAPLIVELSTATAS